MSDEKRYFTIQNDVRDNDRRLIQLVPARELDPAFPREISFDFEFSDDAHNKASVAIATIATQRRSIEVHRAFEVGLNILNKKLALPANMRSSYRLMFLLYKHRRHMRDLITARFEGPQNYKFKCRGEPRNLLGELSPELTFDAFNSYAKQAASQAGVTRALSRREAFAWGFYRVAEVNAELSATVSASPIDLNSILFYSLDQVEGKAETILNSPFCRQYLEEARKVIVLSDDEQFRNIDFDGKWFPKQISNAFIKRVKKGKRQQDEVRDQCRLEMFGMTALSYRYVAQCVHACNRELLKSLRDQNSSISDELFSRRMLGREELFEFPIPVFCTLSRIIGPVLAHWLSCEGFEVKRSTIYNVLSQYLRLARERVRVDRDRRNQTAFFTENRDSTRVRKHSDKR